jgi:tRNA pseudouridine-54 N-methylase
MRFKFLRSSLQKSPSKRNKKRKMLLDWKSLMTSLRFKHPLKKRQILSLGMIAQNLKKRSQNSPRRRKTRRIKRRTRTLSQLRRIQLSNLTRMRKKSLSNLREVKVMTMIVMKKDGNSLENMKKSSRNNHLLAQHLQLQRELLQELHFKKVRRYKLSISVNKPICLTKNLLVLVPKKLH